MAQEKTIYLYASEAMRILKMGSTKGMEESERRIAERGVLPSGYLKGNSGGEIELRPFYLESAILAAAERQTGRTVNSEDRLKRLEDKFDKLIDKLGGLPL